MEDRTPPAGQEPRFHTHTRYPPGVLEDDQLCAVYDGNPRTRNGGILFLTVESPDDAVMVCAALNLYDAREKASKL